MNAHLLGVYRGASRFPIDALQGLHSSVGFTNGFVRNLSTRSAIHITPWMPIQSSKMTGVLGRPMEHMQTRFRTKWLLDTYRFSATSVRFASSHPSSAKHPIPSPANKEKTNGKSHGSKSNDATNTIAKSANHPTDVSTPTTSAAAVKPKKSIKERIKEELLHYWHGSKLLAKEVRISSKLLWHMLKGEQLTRREQRQLKRTASDLFRLVPFSVFLIVPFMELLLPVALKLFPGMLPSTFEAKEVKEEKRRKLLKVRIEMAKFLRETIDESTGVKKGDNTKAPTTELIDFFFQLRNSEEPLDTNELMAIAKKFGDDLTLDNLSRPQLISMCRFMGINTFGTENFLRYQLRNRMRQIKADDRLIAAEGVDTLTSQELIQACSSRGLRTVSVPESQLRMILKQWLDLHLEQQLPSTLLVLTYAFALLAPTPSSAPEALQATLSSLPDELVNEAQLNMLEREGLATAKQRLDVIEEQEELIADERERSKLEEESAERSANEAKEKKEAKLAAEQAKKQESDTHS
ncbi:LETM1-like protein-domain-containing protein [Syncephalis fuscata]|nr:LETM1-like protein-domain-containing protein [Syncephalis fuscata]